MRSEKCISIGRSKARDRCRIARLVGPRPGRADAIIGVASDLAARVAVCPFGATDPCFVGSGISKSVRVASPLKKRCCGHSDGSRKRRCSSRAMTRALLPTYASRFGSFFAIRPAIVGRCASAIELDRPRSLGRWIAPPPQRALPSSTRTRQRPRRGSSRPHLGRSLRRPRSPSQSCHHSSSVPSQEFRYQYCAACARVIGYYQRAGEGAFRAHSMSPQQLCGSGE